MCRSEYIIGIVILVLFFNFSGCYTIPRANRAIGQLNLGNPKKAWEMVSAELSHPTVSSQEDLCELHLCLIQILENIVNHDFAPTDPDRIAKQSYNYVLDNCQAFNKKLQIAENQYAIYFQNTKRSGLQSLMPSVLSNYQKRILF